MNGVFGMTSELSPTHGARVHSSADARPTRDWQIDAAKAVAIALVVLGHASGMPPAYKLFAYSFHVPLFSCCRAGSANGLGSAH